MKARVITHSYHKMHVLKRNIFVSYATKKITKTFRAQIWFRGKGGGGGSEGLPSYISHIHNPKINAYMKIKFNIFQIEISLC